MSVLLVEDSDADAALVTALLHEAAPARFAIERVATLVDALAACEQRPPACAVVDLGLPDADGLEVVRRLASAATTAALVVLTGRQDQELGVEAIQAGAEDYLSKGEMAGNLLVRTIRYAVERKHSALAAAEQGRRLADAQRIAHIGSWEWDLVSGAIAWSDEHYRLLGYEPGSVAPSVEATVARLHPDDAKRGATSVELARSRAAPYSFETRVILPGGEVHWLQVTGDPTLDRAGDVVRLAGTVQDVTTAKEREAALERSRQELLEAQRLAGLGSWHWDIRNDRVSWSEQLYRIFGLSPDERPPTYEGFLACVHPSDRALVEAAVGAALESCEPFEFVARVVRRDGTHCWLLSRGETVDAGNPVIMRGTAQDITEKVRSDAELQRSREQLNEAQRLALVGSWEIDFVTGDTTWSDEQFRMLGYEPGSVAPSPELLLAHVHPDDRESVQELLGATPVPRTFDTRLVAGSGRLREVAVRVEAECDDEGSPRRLFGIVQDVTEQRQAEAERARLSRERELILDASAEGIFGLDLEGRITFANPAAGELLGYEPCDLVGRDAHVLLHARHADGSICRKSHCPIHRAIRTGERVRVDTEVFWHRDGSAVDVEYWSQPIVEGTHILGAVVNFMDIRERKRYEEQLTHQALHDELTKLPNRSLLKDRLDQALARSERRDGTVGVLFLDLDRFKEVNDGLGHSAGDAVLQQVAERLAQLVRPADTVARFGGDEFVVVCDDVRSAWEAVLLGERIAGCFEEPLTAGQGDFYLTASVGVALARRGQSAEELLRDADSAMYRAKERGRARVELFDEEFRARAASRLQIQAELRRALEQDHLHLVYQPIVSLAEGAFVGVEALLRWRHPQHGLVGPADFIPIAEETGLIVGIGDWVLEEAMRQTSRWRNSIKGAENLFVAVNVSARQLLVPNIADVMGRIIAETNIDPGAIHLEVTETTLMRDVELSIETLRGLKLLGANLSVDDFGTGYSSLSYLKRLPLDTIKVDRSFVDGLGSDPNDSSIVSAIVGMGRALGLTTIAEGVETPEQLVELRALGCDLAQGYYFSKPLPAAALEEFCDNRLALPSAKHGLSGGMTADLLAPPVAPPR